MIFGHVHHFEGKLFKPYSQGPYGFHQVFEIFFWFKCLTSLKNQPRVALFREHPLTHYRY